MALFATRGDAISQHLPQMRRSDDTVCFIYIHRPLATNSSTVELYICIGPASPLGRVFKFSRPKITSFFPGWPSNWLPEFGLVSLGARPTGSATQPRGTDNMGLSISRGFHYPYNLD